MHTSDPKMLTIPEATNFRVSCNRFRPGETGLSHVEVFEQDTRPGYWTGGVACVAPAIRENTMIRCLQWGLYGPITVWSSGEVQHMYQSRPFIVARD